jgi:hypothetical protein
MGSIIWGIPQSPEMAKPCGWRSSLGKVLQSPEASMIEPEILEATGCPTQQRQGSGITIIGTMTTGIMTGTTVTITITGSHFFCNNDPQ